MQVLRVPDRKEHFDDAVDLRSLPSHRHIASHPFIDRLRAAIPFDFFGVSGLDLDGYRFGSGNSIDTDLPPAFLEAYYGEDLISVDPFVRASMNAAGAVIEEKVYEASPPPQRLQYLARTFGVLNRTLFPIRRGEVLYGAVTFARAIPFTDDEIKFLEDIAEVTHRVITKAIMKKFSAQTLKLTEGEIVCLKFASLGKTAAEIAIASGYTAVTVDSYIKTAMKKLDADNRVHAIAQAIRRGLIQ